MRVMDVGGRMVGKGEPAFVIAELGINHNGSTDLAHQMIDAAADSGADAVKMQTFLVETMVAPGNPYYEIFKNNEMSDVQDLRGLQQHANERGVVFFSSASTESGLDILEQLDLPLFKVSSANLTNTPLLKRVAGYGRPIIISTGAANLSEIMHTEETLREHGAPSVAILKCTSIYPCPPEQVNLSGLETLRGSFRGPIGFSDHTVGPIAAISAVSQGASIVEKHFTLDNSMEGHDHHFSANPEVLKEMVEGIRTIEAMRGTNRIEPVGEEVEFRAMGRRYVTAMVDIEEGQEISSQMIYPKRPKDGTGIAPEHIDIVVGRKARRTIGAGESVKWEDI